VHEKDAYHPRRPGALETTHRDRRIDARASAQATPDHAERDDAERDHAPIAVDVAERPANEDQ
jgi:hypothetical protein